MDKEAQKISDMTEDELNARWEAGRPAEVRRAADTAVEVETIHAEVMTIGAVQLPAWNRSTGTRAETDDRSATAVTV